MGICAYMGILYGHMTRWAGSTGAQQGGGAGSMYAGHSHMTIYGYSLSHCRAFAMQGGCREYACGQECRGYVGGGDGPYGMHGRGACITGIYDACGRECRGYGALTPWGYY